MAMGADGATTTSTSGVTVSLGGTANGAGAVVVSQDSASAVDVLVRPVYEKHGWASDAFVSLSKYPNSTLTFYSSTDNRLTGFQVKVASGTGTYNYAAVKP